MIAGPDGPTRRLHGTSVDVTERRASEGALDQSRRALARVNDELRGRVEELQTLLNVLQAGVFVAHDPACSSITCNPAGAAMLGIQHGINCSKTGPEASQLPFRVLKGGVEVAPGELPIQRAARTGRPVVGEEFEVLRADGTTVVLYQYAAPLFDPEGKVRGCLGVMVDISARLEAERKLADSRARAERQRRVYEAILTNTPDLAHVWDLNHRFIYANDGLLKMWGKRWEEAMGRNCLELGYEPWHAAMHDREIDQVVATRQPLRGEVPFSGANGRRVYDYILVPVLGENGEVEAVAGTTRDVTDRKNVEEQRERVLASERLARLTAERAGKLKEEFLATLSHELRTPLNAMLGWIQILRKRPPTPELLEQGLTVIHRNASAQSRLIGDLLDMSRIISGKVRMEVQKVELPPVIEAALEAARPAAEAKGVVLERAIEPLAVPVLGDATRLQQVFWNLLSNAVKFTPRGGRVRVVLAAGAEHVDFSVADTGQGIHPDFLPHVFERFRQADSSASRSHGGLGLGLAIVKQLVELHGGSVHAASAGEGHGATFTVRLPLGAPRRPKLDSAPSGPEVVGSGEVSGPPRLDGVRVLVVDDEADARMLVRYLLEECGAQVLLASSTDEALALARKSPPHVVLSDIGMPQRDGYELVSTLRREGFRVPAAAVSAFVREEDRARAISAGYQMHLAKPVQPEEFVLRVKDAIEAGRLVQAAERATRDRDRRMERQVALSVWKEDVLGRDRDRYNKTLFDNLRMSFNQGIGFGGLVTLPSLIADTSKIVDGNYLVGTDLMDLLIENARMAESAMRRFEEIDQLIRGEIDLREASIAEVHTLVCRVADSLHSLLDIKSQSVVVSEPPRQSGIVRISERLLTDAVRELLINAMKFSKPSSQIFVLFRRTSSHLHCSFVNTPGENQFGSRGVPEEHERLIFEPFYRIVRTVDERFGTLDYGLGLSVVEKIIQGHQGRIRAGNIHDFFSKGAEGESAANFELQLPLIDT